MDDDEIEARIALAYRRAHVYALDEGIDSDALGVMLAALEESFEIQGLSDGIIGRAMS